MMDELLRCDEDINDCCEWSPVLNLASAESDSSNQQQLQQESKEDEFKEQSEGDEAETRPEVKVSSEEDSKKSSEQQQDDVLQKKEHPLYSLRRNPKRSRRFIDQEYAFDSILPASGSHGSAAVTSPNAAAIKKSFSSNVSPSSADKARACTECGKEFSSWKALFGHMRCHPEREWRGIQRPENMSEYKLSCRPTVRRSKKSRHHTPVAAPLHLEDDQDDELEAMYIKVVPSDESDTESIEAAYINGSCSSSGGGFSNRCVKTVTGKRSKRSRQTTSGSPSPPSNSKTGADLKADFKEERDMARCLVMLACAGQSHEDDGQEEEGTSTTNEVPDNRTAVSGSSIEMEDLEDECALVAAGDDDLGVQQELSRKLDEPQKQGDHLVHIHGTGTGTGTTTVTSRDGLGEPSLLVCGSGPLELLDQDLESIRMKYECSTCKRIFKSHQALGGHRASHKKVKGCFAKTNLTMSEGMLADDELIVDDDFLKSDEQLLPSEFGDNQPPLLVSSSTFPGQAQVQQQGHHFQRQQPPPSLPHGYHLQHFEHGAFPSGSNFSSRNRELEFVDAPVKKLVSNSLRGHECSICHRVFTSGQALGGHKRCHWGGGERPVAESLITSVPITTAASVATMTSSKPVQVMVISSSSSSQAGSGDAATTSSVMSSKLNHSRDDFLDLNMPALVDEEEGTPAAPTAPAAAASAAARARAQQQHRFLKNYGAETPPRVADYKSTFSAKSGTPSTPGAFSTSLPAPKLPFTALSGPATSTLSGTLSFGSASSRLPSRVAPALSSAAPTPASSSIAAGPGAASGSTVAPPVSAVLKRSNASGLLSPGVLETVVSYKAQPLHP